MLDHTIVESFKKSPTVEVVIVQKLSGGEKFAVVTIDHRTSQVRSGNRFSGPSNSSRAIEYVAIWGTEKQARSKFLRITSTDM